MELKIGMQNVGREVILEMDATADDVTQQVQTAMRDSAPLVLKDSKNRTVVLATSAIAYVEMGDDSARKVGFGLA